jgi:sugar phosphate isomerase/epimerase
VFALRTSLVDLTLEPAKSADAFVRRALDLGADAVVIDGGLEAQIVAAVRVAVVAQTCPVAAIGSPTPLSAELARGRPGVPLPTLADLDDGARQMAVRVVRRTIELAAEIGTRDVFVSPGRIVWPEKLEDPELALETLDPREDPAKDAARSVLETRGKVATPHFDALRRSLDELIAVADRLSVTLSLSMAHRLDELLSFQETGRVLDEFEGAPLGLWLDTASAARLDWLGLRSAGSWPNSFRKSVRGVSLRDGKPGEEGGFEIAIPGDGKIDFAGLASAFDDPGRAAGEVADTSRRPVFAFGSAREVDSGLTRETVSHLRRLGLVERMPRREP